MLRRPPMCHKVWMFSLLLALPAIAATKVVVVPYAPLPGVPEAAAVRATELLTQDLQGRTELQVVDLPRKVAKPSDDALSQVRAALGKASALARKDRHGEAAEQLQKAIALFMSHPALLDAELGQQMVDAALQLAVERLMAGDEDGGDAALAQLVRLAPERNIEKSDYPPAFSVELASVKKRLLGEPRGSLRVLAPPGAGEARVTVDGKTVRSPPVHVDDLIPGEHFVRVERGGVLWGEKVVVIAGVETKVAPVDEPVTRALLQGELDRGAVQAAAKLARDSGAQAAFFGAVVKHGDGVRVRTFLARGEKVAPLPALEMDAELLGGLVQMVKVGDEAAAKLAAPSFDEPPLPIILDAAPPPVVLAKPPEIAAAPPARQVLVPGAPVAQPPTAKPAPAVQHVPVRADEPPSRALVVPRQPSPDDDGPAPVVQSKTAPPPKSTSRLAALEPEAVKTIREPEKKNHTALWIAAGVLIAGGIATGGYFLYEAGRTPTTATVTTTWGH